MPSRPAEQPTGRHLWQIKAARDVALIAAGLGTVYALYVLRSIFMPVFLALLLAYFFNPLVKFVATRWRWPRALTAGVVVAVSAVFFVGGVFGLYPLVAEQLRALATRLPEYVQTIATQSGIDLNDLGGEAGEILRGLDDPQHLMREVMGRAGQALGVVKRFVGGATYVVLALVLVPIYFFFFSWKFDETLDALAVYLPDSRRDRILAVARRMDQSVAAFIRGRLFVALVMAALFSIGWWIAGVPYWFLLGSVAGLLSIVPYGPAPFWFIAILLKYMDVLQGGGPVELVSIVVWPSVVYLAVQFFEGWILTPWIQSDQTDMSVPTVLIVAFVGGAVGGFLGLLLSIPLAACTKILGEEVILPRLRQWARTH